MKKIISICISACLFLSQGICSVNAEDINEMESSGITSHYVGENDFTNNSEANTENTQVQNSASASFIVNNTAGTLTYTNLTGEVDNSNLNVEVTKVVGETETIIYTGPLSGYDDGAWIHIDFSKIGFLVLFEWESLENEAVYIVPQSTEADQNTIINENISNMALNSEIIQPSLNITANYYLNNVNIGNNTDVVLTPDDSVMATFNIFNNGTSSQSIQLLICIYDNNGKLINMASANDVVLPNNTKDITKTLNVPTGLNNCYAKVMLWNSTSGLMPLHDAKQIGSASTIISTANVNCVLNKEYNLILTANNIPSNETDSFTIKYDATKLGVVDLCSLTYTKELVQGEISGTEINITNFDSVNGRITFTNSNSTNLSVAKILNGIKFKSLLSDTQTVITIE